MTDVIESVDVNVPISIAYNQWTQFESFPEFMEGVDSVQQTDARHTHWVTDIGGVRREFDAETTEQHPDERIAWKSVGGDTEHAGVVTFHRLADTRTRVTVQLVWEPQGLAEKVGSALNIDNRQVKADTVRFKKFIEERGTETGGFRGEQPAPGQVVGGARPGPQSVRGAHLDAPASGQGDVVDVLSAQHQQVKAAFARVQMASGQDKAQLFAELVDLLKVHEAGEQQVVHPVTGASAAVGGQVAAGRIEEETEADRAIAELQTLGVQHPDFNTKLEAFHQAVLRHADHEEQDEFPLLRQNIPAGRLQAMAEDLRDVQAGRS
ncbi:MAG TPA: SRPBCC family protein [Actinocrinis sp.]|nr:SRPBCC family protein [Actinocrinis sp.]